jgi:hypothetical protein
MNDAPSFTRPERAKEQRVRALRARFSKITRFYERALAGRKWTALALPAITGIAIGAGAYFVIFR